MIPYEEFLKSKVPMIQSWGFEVGLDEINPILKPHQAAMTQWMVLGGRRACFAAFGLGKSIIQLETIRLILDRAGGRGLIIAPLGVRQEFRRDAKELLGWETPPQFVRRIEECDETGIYITNYETVRDGKLDPRLFTAVSLDEAAVLRGFGSVKTFRTFMDLFTEDGGPLANRRKGTSISYRFVATATPSPNDYIELLAYSAFLGILDVSQGKTRFFKRDSTKADVLTLLPHKTQEFWMWVASWALFVQAPSDLGYSDDGYVMPELDVRWHEIEHDMQNAGFRRDGQAIMLQDSSIGVSNAAKVKRDSMAQRIQKMLELREDNRAAHRIIWHTLEPERKAIEKVLPDCVTVYGTQKLEKREEAVAAFSDGAIQELAAKPVMLGSGCNLQKHCSWAIYLGIGFKFNEFIQSVHRIQRFLQPNQVRIDLIYSEAERGVRKALEKKWKQHKDQVTIMVGIIKEYGLSQEAMAQALTRKMGTERVEVSGPHHRLVNWDSVLETAQMETDSVGLILTSIPFAAMYEYSPNYADLGHSDNPEHFWEQMDYLTPDLLRVLQPGRLAAIHVKDRIIPGGMTGLGFQTVYPFHCRAIEHYTKHGFQYMGMKTIVTDVVRENNQTYRLGWSEQCKDGSKMGVGMPEYLLIFRKPPTDSSNGYADIPIVKSKPRKIAATKFEREEPGEYSRSRWQIDAHGFARSSGNRNLLPEELMKLTHAGIFRTFRTFSLETVYDFEHHVKLGDSIEYAGKLPTTFMLLQPQSWHDDVWTDITRMLTLNTSQYCKGKEMHICPMQFDLADRAIEQWSMPGETVYDPFSGLGTVPVRAIKKGRFGIGCELAHSYFMDAAAYCRAEEQKVSMPTLFDIAEFETDGEEEIALPAELEEVAA